PWRSFCRAGGVRVACRPRWMPHIFRRAERYLLYISRESQRYFIAIVEMDGHFVRIAGVLVNQQERPLAIGALRRIRGNQRVSSFVLKIHVGRIELMCP